MKKTFFLALLLICMATTFAFSAEKRPFDGKSLKGWKPVSARTKNTWIVGRASIDKEDDRAIAAQPLLKKDKQLVEGDLINFVEGAWTEEPRGGVDFYSEEKYGDCTIDLEFMVSKNANSGVYVMGEYEVQILDSWGRTEMTQGDVGALYGAAPPKVNASLEPGKWQHMVIEFIAPKFDDDGNKLSKAKFVKITLNGKVVQENVEMEQQTPGGITGRECPKGPLMFQGNHGPVAYRNIKIMEKD